MDIVGPLPRSSSGKRFILVICDYATRYPEAVALRTMDANTIAEELVQFFAWVGIPEEILTDQVPTLTHNSSPRCASSFTSNQLGQHPTTRRLMD